MTAEGDARGGVGTVDETDHLLRNFVDHLMARGREARSAQNPDLPVPEIDWQSIWNAGSGAESTERAAGSIVTAAFLVASDIAGGSDQLLAMGAAPGISRVPTLEPAAPARPIATPVVEAPRPAPQGHRTAPDIRVVRDRRQHVRSLPPAAPHLATIFTWVRNVGAVLLLFVAWQLWGTAITQHHAQDQLRAQFDASVHKHHSSATTPATPTGPALIPSTTLVAQPPDGTVVARLDIPAIGVNQYVVMGTSEADLSKGPGHYFGTAMPGQAGNVAIAGHRTTNGAPFNQLGNLKPGDKVYLTTTAGEVLTYVIAAVPTPVSPSDVTVLDNFGDNRITLTTCNPEFSAAQRLIAVGELTVPNAPVPTLKKTPVDRYHLADQATASWNFSELPFALLEAAALIALGLGLRWITKWFGREGRWLVLVPMWATLLYLLFVSLTSLLPSTL